MQQLSGLDASFLALSASWAASSGPSDAVMLMAMLVGPVLAMPLTAVGLAVDSTATEAAT